MKVSRSAISELESGKRRSISVAELLVLAAALDQPPALLLFPPYPDGHVRPVPGAEVTAYDAVEWVGGQRIMIVDPSPEKPSIEPFPSPLVRMSTEREGLLQGWMDARRTRRKGDQGLEDSEVLLKQLFQQRDALNRQIAQLGGKVHDGEG